ncbi:MAG: hypothetical protein FWD15_01450 [Alphaproteobacteria bacterium]|nr:hypothetical protein [Alphaproteobacteria bacterium]
MNKSFPVAIRTPKGETISVSTTFDKLTVLDRKLAGLNLGGAFEKIEVSTIVSIKGGKKCEVSREWGKCVASCIFCPSEHGEKIFEEIRKTFDIQPPQQLKQRGST